jgi:hypothetical protein
MVTMLGVHPGHDSGAALIKEMDWIIIKKSKNLHGRKGVDKKIVGELEGKK